MQWAILAASWFMVGGYAYWAGRMQERRQWLGWWHQEFLELWRGVSGILKSLTDGLNEALMEPEEEGDDE